MNTALKVAGSLFVGVLGFLAAGIAVTEALAPHVWPSAMLGLPGGPTERTARRFRATTAAFVGGGALATVVLATWAVDVATAMLLGGLPVGIVAAAAAAYLVSRRRRPSDDSSGSPPANSS